MAKDIWLNRLSYSIDHKKIDEAYDIFEIKTSEQKLRPNAQILDMPSNELTVRSICFPGYGTSLYVLLLHDCENRMKLASCFNTLEGGNRLSIKKRSCASIPQNTLAQLFLNQLPNLEHALFSFHNLTGRLYYFNPSWISESQIRALEFRIDENDCLGVNVQTFTSLAKKQYLSFEKLKLNDYPRYVMGNSATLRRMLAKEDMPECRQFIARTFKNSKSAISFFDFSDLQEFNASKVGAIAQVVEAFNERYEGMISLAFRKAGLYESIVFDKRKKPTEERNERVASVLRDGGIAVVDAVGDEISKIMAQALVTEITNNEKYRGLAPELSAQVVPESLNLRIIHNKEYYEDDDDQYEHVDSAVVQHVTIEDFNAFKKPYVTSILKELAIKHDITHRRFSTFDWPSYRLRGRYIFALPFLEEGGKREICFMSVEPDGRFAFKTTPLNWCDDPEYAKYANAAINALGAKERGHKALEGLVVDPEGHVNIIWRTNLFPIPNYPDLKKELHASSREHHDKDLIVSILKYLASDTGDEAYLPMAGVLEAEQGSSVSKKRIDELIKEHPRPKVARQEINEELYERTGYKLRSSIKGKETREHLYDAILDIKYLPEESMYWVGSIGNGLNNFKIERGCPVRQITGHNDDSVFFSDLLGLMNVDLIRNAQLTVLPFPFKYIREYRSISNDR